MEVTQIVLDWTNSIEVHKKRAKDENLEPPKEGNSSQEEIVDQNNHGIPGIPFN